MVVRSPHFVERHGALIIVALGESIAAVGISASRQPMTGSLVSAAVLGLAVTAAVWWVYSSTGDDGRAEGAFTAAGRGQRPGLALSAYFFAHIPMLLGIMAVATGIKLTIGHAAQARPLGQALALAGGVALFLAGNAWFRAALRIGPAWPRLVLAGFALAATALGVTVAIEAELGALLAGLVLLLAAEPRLATRGGPDPGGLWWGRALVGAWGDVGEDGLRDRAIHAAGHGPRLE